jgi:hypothetical protein
LLLQVFQGALEEEFMSVKIMPSVIRSEVVLKNIGLVEHYARCSFFDALNGLQSYHTPFSRDGEGVLIDFGDKDPEATRHILQVSELQDDWAFQDEDQYWVRDGISDGLALLGEVDGEIATLIPRVVGRFLIARSRGFEAGSISDMIGTIWLNPRRAWTPVLYADRILHEYVHQCLFLHEMTSTLFTVGVKLLAADDAAVTSAILKRKRGLDKAYHSAFVSFVLAQLYEALGERITSSSFADEHLDRTLAELFERTKFLTPAGVRLLEELAAELNEFKHRMS